MAGTSGYFPPQSLDNETDRSIENLGPSFGKRLQIQAGGEMPLPPGAWHSRPLNLSLNSIESVNEFHSSYSNLIKYDWSVIMSKLFS